MKQLMMKARAGVTLVELLVVILIVTILSVSMLPLLKPFVTQAQYAAEPIPVIGNIRTKIGVYEYNVNHLPVATLKGTETQTLVPAHTWVVDPGDSQRFVPAFYDLVGDGAATINEATNSAYNVSSHLGSLVDVDYQDLKGKRSKPINYHYYTCSESTNQCYVVGCFGDGNGGLKAGTGYAVCEINYPGKKYVGTWERYKPIDESSGPINFGFATVADGEKVNYCFVPSGSSGAGTYDPSDTAELPDLISLMRQAGWQF